MAKILIVENIDPVVAELKGVLLKAGHDVVGVAACAEDAFDLAARHRPDVAFVALQLTGDIDGIEAAMQLVERHGCGIIVATSYPAAVVDSSRIHDLPCAVLHKPFSEQDVLAALDRCPRTCRPGG